MNAKQQTRIDKLNRQDLRSRRIVLVPLALAKADDTLRAAWAVQNGLEVHADTIYLLRDDEPVTR